MWYQVSIKYVLDNGNVGRIQKVVDCKTGAEAASVVLALPAVKQLKLPVVTGVAPFDAPVGAQGKA